MPALFRIAAFLLVVSSPLWFYAFLYPTPLYNSTSAPLVVIWLLLLNLPLLFHVTRNDAFLRRVMGLGMIAKLAAASLYLYMSFHVYGLASDALHYFFMGRQYAGDVNWGGRWLLLHPFWSTNSIYMINGAMQVLLGSSLPAITLIFAMSSFWGDYFFYRAFSQAVPQGDRRALAFLLFFLPSITYWPACIGKDALIQLCLGMAFYGFALLLRRFGPGSLLLLVTGLLGAMVIRPHVALMLVLALVVPYMVSKNRMGIVGTLSRTIALPLLLVGTLYLAREAGQFLHMDDVSQSGAVAQMVGRNNDFGGSAFNGDASLAARTLAAPVLFFRPFPWEVRSLTSAVAACEGLLLLAIAWKRRAQLLFAARTCREHPLLFVAGLFVIEFSVVFSAAITNFGLLARERVMALPMLMLLFCACEVAHPASAPAARWQQFVHPSGLAPQRGS